jgi:uncharacterized protein (TIGR00369 family)
MASDETMWSEGPPLSEFGQTLGPVHRRRVDDSWAYGFEARTSHRNEAGVMHGGAMAALIDEVIGTMVTRAVGRPHVTVQLNVTFLKPVQVGHFIEPSCDIISVTRSMTFAEAKMRVAGEVVATATLIFKAVRPVTVSEG